MQKAAREWRPTFGPLAAALMGACTVNRALRPSDRPHTSHLDAPGRWPRHCCGGTAYLSGEVAYLTGGTAYLSGGTAYLFFSFSCFCKHLAHPRDFKRLLETLRDRKPTETQSLSGHAERRRNRYAMSFVRRPLGPHGPSPRPPPRRRGRFAAGLAGVRRLGQPFPELNRASRRPESNTQQQGEGCPLPG